jgi:hypothetical protein
MPTVPASPTDLKNVTKVVPGDGVVMQTWIKNKCLSLANLEPNIKNCHVIENNSSINQLLPTAIGFFIT